MGAIKNIHEGSACYATATFKDTGGTATTPSTVRYRVDCETTGEELKGWTTLTAALSVSVTIPGSLNVMQDEKNRKERKSITFEADYGTDNAFKGTQFYDVRNRKNV